MESTQPLRSKVSVKTPPKASTGIAGFDEITGGGLPRGRTTLLLGGPGSGKTVFALQFLAHGAAQYSEPGVFVAFEESAKSILVNAQSFGWNLAGLQRKKQLYVLNAQPPFDLVQSGDFDLGGMLAVLAAKVKETGARRIVFDALDVLLLLLPDVRAERREAYRLHAWLLEHDLTAIVTLKSKTDGTYPVSLEPFAFMQFMTDCTVILNHSASMSVSQRTLRVQKYRGSGFDENESPFLIGASGVEVVLAHSLVRANAKVSSERISSGIHRLDTMLGGGFYRGASVLITGSSGTAKTTLCGAFAESACSRGERTLFVCFDTNSTEVIRNLSSVGIQLDRYIAKGSLHMVSARTISGSAETYLVRIKALAKKYEATCIVVDPASAWSKSGTDLSSQSVADRLIDWSKSEGMTLMCTSMVDEMSGQGEHGSPLQTSALVDTWIHLSYLMQAGERNRGLSIVKSRGTAHSNQLRELILSDQGVTLADPYTAGGEVLMGTLRWEKERDERVKREANDDFTARKGVQLDAEEADLEVRLQSLKTMLTAKQVEKALLMRATKSEKGDLSREDTQLKELRGSDVTQGGLR